MLGCRALAAGTPLAGAMLPGIFRVNRVESQLKSYFPDMKSAYSCEISYGLIDLKESYLLILIQRVLRVHMPQVSIPEICL